MNQTLGQQDFLGMIDGIIPQLNEAKDPSEVLIKYASDNNLSEEALAHLGKTYNVLKTYSHFGHAKNASDRGKSFKVIDTDDMVKKYATYKVVPTESAPVFMTTPLAEKKQEKKASVYDGYEISDRLDNGKHYMPTVNETPINYNTVKVASKKEASEVDRIFQKNEEEANMRFFIGAKKIENEMIASKIASQIKKMSKDEWSNNVWNEFCKVANNHYSDEINVALNYIEGFLDKDLVRFNKQAFVRDSDPDLIHPKYNDMFTGVFEIIDNMQMLKAAAKENDKQKGNGGDVSIAGALSSLRMLAEKNKAQAIVDTINDVTMGRVDAQRELDKLYTIFNFAKTHGTSEHMANAEFLVQTAENAAKDPQAPANGPVISPLLGDEISNKAESNIAYYQQKVTDSTRAIDAAVNKANWETTVNNLKYSPEAIEYLKAEAKLKAVKVKNNLTEEEAKQTDAYKKLQEAKFNLDVVATKNRLSDEQFKQTPEYDALQKAEFELRKIKTQNNLSDEQAKQTDAYKKLQEAKFNLDKLKTQKATQDLLDEMSPEAQKRKSEEQTIADYDRKKKLEQIKKDQDPEEQKKQKEKAELDEKLDRAKKKDELSRIRTQYVAQGLSNIGSGFAEGAKSILGKLDNAYSTLSNRLDAQYAATSQAYANAMANKDEFKQKMMNPYVKDDFKAMLDHNVNMLYRTDPIISKQPWTQVKDSVDSILRQAPSITQDRQALKQLLRSQLSLEGGVDLGSVKTMRQIEA